MPFDAEMVVALALLGGLIAIDGTSFGQFMVSRPFVAAILGGWVAGSPENGAMAGIVLESLHLGVRPVGASKYPEGGPAAVAAGAIYALADPTAITLLVITGGALVLERIGGETIHGMRLANVRIINGKRIGSIATTLQRRHLTTIGLDFVRGMCLVVVGLIFLAFVIRFAVPLWGMSEELTGILLMSIVVAMLASAVRMLGSRYWFGAVGAGIGLVALFLGS